VILNRYWAYGLRMDADLECPELPLLPAGAGDADVTIRLLPAAGEASESLEDGYYEVQPELFRMVAPGVAVYRVEEGKRILITPFPGVPVDELRLFLLG